jgi:hypothetical protein
MYNKKKLCKDKIKEMSKCEVRFQGERSESFMASTPKGCAMSVTVMRLKRESVRSLCKKKESEDMLRGERSESFMASTPKGCAMSVTVMRLKTSPFESLWYKSLKIKWNRVNSSGKLEK